MRFIVNQAFVRTQFPAEEPLGKSISVNMDTTNPFGEIIGIVGDVRENTLTSDPAPTVYYVHAHLIYNGMVILVRTRKDPKAIVAPVRGIMHDLDPALPVADVRSMETVLGATYGRERFGAVLLGGFSFSSLLLAAVGIYGVLAYSVSERTREIGVRKAIGARKRDISFQFITEAMTLTGVGGILGIILSLLFSFLLKMIHFPSSVPIWAVLLAFAVASSVGLFFGIYPAVKAAKLDPVIALRYE
jgi:ABC-type antimicrobial peptide transport system permease subunit